MNRDMTKLFLPIFYGFCFILLVGAIILMYNMDTDQKNRLLQIQKNLDIENTGEIVKLELNDANKKGEVTYHVEDPSIVTVNEDGSLVSLKEGTTKVTVTTKDNAKSQTIVVNVGKEAIKEYKENNKNEEQDKNQNSTENKKPDSSQKPPQNIEQNPSQEPEISDEVPIEIVATKITLNQSNVALYIGDELKLTTTIEPENTDNKNITWTSSNGSVATVSNNGNVKALSEGTTIITVKTANNITATCNITVKKKQSSTQANIGVENIYLNYASTTINVDSSITLTTMISPSNATNKNITWTSSNTGIATVNSTGKVVGKKEGTVTITARSSNGKKATCKVIVKPKPIAVTGVKLNKTSATIVVGGNITLSATISPSTATDKNITWTSSNTSVATVSNTGKVTAKKEGTVTITAKSSNGKTATCKVTVNPKPVAVTKVSLDQTNTTINVGKTVTLIATIAPSNAVNKNVTWTSSNTNVATVSNTGKVIAKKEGTAIITVKTNDGNYTSKCTVTVVSRDTILVTGVTLNRDNATVFLNANKKTVELTATVSPSNATNKNVTWSSSNKNVATVNANGVVTAKNPGVSTISVTTADGSKVASMKITVKKKVVIIIGASQVTRMVKTNEEAEYIYKTTKNNYRTSDGTLVFAEKGGTGMDWQVSNGYDKDGNPEGLHIAKKSMEQYSGVKKYVNFYIHFPLVGNTIKKMTCDEISISNNDIKQFVINYNNAIQSLKNSGYNVYGYVDSMHPVKVSQANYESVVTNQNVNACSKGYRSNWKYYQFNKAVKKNVESNYSTNLKYQELFTQIMNVNSEGKNFTFKISYNTSDGVHWDSATTRIYLDMMLGYSGDLN